MTNQMDAKQVEFIYKLWIQNPELADRSKNKFGVFFKHTHNLFIIAALLVYYFNGTELPYTISYYWVSFLLFLIFSGLLVLIALIFPALSKNDLETRRVYDAYFLRYSTLELYLFPSVTEYFPIITSAIVAGLFYVIGDYTIFGMILVVNVMNFILSTIIKNAILKRLREISDGILVY